MGLGVVDHALREEESGPPAHGHDSRPKGGNDVRGRGRRREGGGEEREELQRRL